MSGSVSRRLVVAMPVAGSWVMNFPIWGIPGSGLLIALVAIVHVFISHFAVGGGLFLVLSERRARRDGDTAFLEYLKGLSRFFAVLTLVAGAVTGVGIWFTIALVNPAATSSLINTFVWGWAIEWTFFVAEIAAAMVYYYGWDRLSPKVHMTVGWIYFANAWLSLVIINGILTYMLTPGAWLETRGFWAGFFNPTYFPSVIARTLISMGLAGMYALLVASRSTDVDLKERVARWAGLRWVLPSAALLVPSLIWYMVAAASAGVPVAEILGAADGSPLAVLGAMLTVDPTSGQPIAQQGVRAAVFATVAVVLLTLAIATVLRRSYGVVATALLMAAGFVAFGGAEWSREDLRKPWVIGNYMFVNSVRLPAPEAVTALQPQQAEHGDPLSVDALNRGGVLAASPWVAAPAEFGDDSLDPMAQIEAARAAGEQVFRLECFACHTTDGYLAIRPLVSGRSVAAVEGTIDRLARPVSATGEPAAWTDAGLRLETLRGRRMPPFVGTDAERHALAVYLAALGGADLAETAMLGVGATYYESECSFCHDPSEDFAFAELLAGESRTADDYYALLARLSEIDELMLDFEGTDEQRRAVAEYLVTLQEESNR
jgi:mono/diheme cytochrome c family protein